MPRRALTAVAWTLGVALLTAGCSTLSSDAGKGRSPEPDAAFLKKVAKDPFPKATGAAASLNTGS